MKKLSFLTAAIWALGPPGCHNHRSQLSTRDLATMPRCLGLSNKSGSSQVALLEEERKGYKGQVDSRKKTFEIQFRQVNTLEHRSYSLQQEWE
jgi:hypothetical protein